MARDFYSLAAARRSLGHFAGGKLVSAAIGFAYLLTTVRSMEPGDYGRYVAVLATCEIFYLVTGLGLSTVAQRYVAEYRVRALAEAFCTFLNAALRRRLLLSIGFVLALMLLWTPLMSLTGLALDPAWRPAIALLLVANAGVAFLEEVMGALLLQGYSQALGIARNLAKLAIAGGLVVGGFGLTLGAVLLMECAVATSSWLAAEFVVRRWARRAPSSAQAREHFASPRMDRVALRFYLVQLLGQAYGTNMVKLLVTRLLGATQTAALGVAQSLADMLRNYMPAHLLAAWVRPIMVARYVERRDVGELSQIANLVLKLNLLGLMPAAAAFAVVGDPLLSWLTAGRYPTLGLLLALLAGLAVLQSAHLLLTMITLTLEQPGVSLRATLAAAATLPVLVAAMMGFGLYGAALGLALGEAVWVGVAWALLHRRGFALHFDLAGSCKVGAAALAAGLVGAAALRVDPGLPWAAAAAAMALSYLVALLLLRPAAPSEIAMVRRLIASRRPPGP